MRKIATAGVLAASGALLATSAVPVFAYPPGTALTVSGPASVASATSFTATAANAEPGCSIDFSISGSSSSGTASGAGAASATLSAPGNGGTYSVSAEGCGESASTTISVSGPSVSGPSLVRKRARGKFVFTGLLPDIRGGRLNRKVRVYAIRGNIVRSKLVKAHRSGTVIFKFKFKKTGLWAIVGTKNSRTASMIVRVVA